MALNLHSKRTIKIGNQCKDLQAKAELKFQSLLHITPTSRCINNIFVNLKTEIFSIKKTENQEKSKLRNSIS